MRGLMHDFYVQPMDAVYCETIVMYLIWLLGMFVLRDRAKRIVAGLGLVLSVILIFVFTVYGRKTAEHDVSLMPFITFERAKIKPELYRTMYMNMLLFLPFGMSMPFVFAEKVKMKGLLTIGAGLLLSVAVESVQFFFRLGNCETDDVIMNTTGVIIGSTVYLIAFLVQSMNRRKKKRN